MGFISIFNPNAYLKFITKKLKKYSDRKIYNDDKRKFDYSAFPESPIIYVACPECGNSPTGGVKYLYKYVDILNSNGFKAAILHSNLNFRCTWFENNTVIAYRTEIAFKQSDYLVFPEVDGPDLASIESGIKKVIINQNANYTFNGYSIDKNDVRCSYLHKDLVGVYCTSYHIFEYIKYVFPSIYTFRGRVAIDGSVFTYCDKKERRIALMVRKLSEESHQVINILKFRGALKNFEIEIIENKNEKEVADALRRSLIFLSFSYREGLGLPPLEAMKSGCIVIGYHGTGGREYFKGDFSYPIESGDVLEFAKTVEDVIRDYDENPEKVLQMGQRASKFVESHYCSSDERNDVVNFWKEIQIHSEEATRTRF